MSTRRNIFIYCPQEDNRQKVMHLRPFVEQQGFQIVYDSEQANIIISVGSDGDFLQAVQKTGFREDCLYAGISIEDTNSFYCDFPLSQITALMPEITSENLEVRRYPVIDVQVNNATTFHCLNEVSIRSSIIKTFALDVFVDDFHFETFRGDGLVISTPTGSTAYNKSLHGAVVDPLLQCYQISEIASLNNNTYRTLGSPFILSKDRHLTLKVVQDGNDHPIIGIDNEALAARHIQQVTVSLSDKKVKTVKLKNNSFWEKVQRTFL
ncbi:MAG: NAD kinase [Bacillaceae bacterium]